MSPLTAALTTYVAVRRSLGFTCRTANLLRGLVAFIEDAGSPFITTQLACQWATRPPTAEPSTWAWRLGIARRFAVWCHATDPRTEVPAGGLVGQRYRRKPPRLYRDDDVIRVLQAAAALRSPRKLRGLTYATLFGLLAVTGLRVGEALHLDRADVDLEDGVLVIRRTKFGKSRLVPIHPTTAEALRAYRTARDRRVPTTAPAFFISERGTRITEYSARYTFAAVSRAVGLRAPTTARRNGQGPRLHDLRHRFAAKTLITWYRTGADVEREVPKLATYLGHVHVSDTYWYLEAVPELLHLAAARVTQAGPEVAP